MNNFFVLDTETTGLDDDAEMIEFAGIRCQSDGSPGDFKTVGVGLSRLIKPSVPISIEAMAVHHITEDDVAGASDLPQLSVDEVLRYSNSLDVNAYVAHNSAFDKRICGQYLDQEVPWICTYKVALRLWPDAPSYKNAVLFYYNDLHKGDDRDWRQFFARSQLHRALPDAILTAHLFGKMLELISFEDMIEISSQPGLLPRVPFGKNYGKKWSEVDYGYLKWAKSQDFDEDVLYTVNTEIKRRYP